MSITVNEASAVLREAVRNTIRKRSLLFLIQGGVMVVAGFLALIYPAFASTGVTVLLGWLLVLSGLVQVLSLVGATQVPYFWMRIISVGLQMVVGLLLIFNPEAAIATITLLMLVLFLVGGIAQVVFAVMIRPMQDWGWILAAGAVAILCAVVLIGNLSNTEHWLLGMLLGIELISEGAAQGYLAWRLRKKTAVEA